MGVIFFFFFKFLKQEKIRGNNPLEIQENRALAPITSLYFLTFQLAVKSELSFEVHKIVEIVFYIRWDGGQIERPMIKISQKKKKVAN